MTKFEQTGCHSSSRGTGEARILASLQRLEGQVRGVQHMVEEDAHPVEVLTQLAAMIGATRSVGLVLLEDHVRGCVLSPHEHGLLGQDELLAELIVAIGRFERTAN